MWVKICGLTNLPDALAATQAGADALGFVFVPSSPRVVTRDRVARILEALPAAVLTVGVVADESPDFLKRLLRVCPLKALQFHGEEPPGDLLGLIGLARLIKAIRVRDAQGLEPIPRYRGVDAVLLESTLPDPWGGTGVSFDGRLVMEAKTFGIPVIVAGGLNPTNVAAVAQQVQPYGVDVSRGVEASPGRKDHRLIKDFVVRAKSPHTRVY
jgi:phosphoribosylanthranilate isomerase